MNEDCKIKWFSTKTVGLGTLDKEIIEKMDFYCNACKNLFEK